MPYKCMHTAQIRLVCLQLCPKMDGHWSWRCWLPLLTLWTAKTLVCGLELWLPRVVLQQLEESGEQFDLWTRQLSQHLSSEDQQRLAWNVHFLDEPKSTLQLRQIQQQLSPRENSISNPCKLWLWISFYWQLRRSHQLVDNENVLLPQFALTLLQLQTDQQWNLDLQNMLQSLPSHLVTIVKSRWLCLKHPRDQLYLLPGRALQLGANGNCCLWQVKLLDKASHWLRLENACEQHAPWFVNLQQSHSSTYTLMSSPTNDSSFLCLRNGVGVLLKDNSSKAENNCQWQLNDCGHLRQDT